MHGVFKTFLGLLLAGFSLALAQTAPPAPAPPSLPPNLQPEQRTLTTADLARFLLTLQPQKIGERPGRLEVIAPVLHSALASSFDALVHGWCENPGFLTCNPPHYPIPVTVITGRTGLESWRDVASSRPLYIPGALSSHAGAVYALEKPPSTGVWLAWGREDGLEYVLTGPAIDGAGDTALLVKAPALASAMHKQMFVAELTKQAARWTP